MHATCLQRWVDIVRKYYFEAEENCFSEANNPRVILADGANVEMECE